MIWKDTDPLNQFFDQHATFLVLCRRPYGLDVKLLKDACHLFEAQLQLALLTTSLLFLGGLTTYGLYCRTQSPLLLRKQFPADAIPVIQVEELASLRR